jgi:xylulose-5-phosphate/fructose-6-phosphate phosphoketolase
VVTPPGLGRSGPPARDVVSERWLALDHLTLALLRLREDHLPARPLHDADLLPRPRGRWGRSSLQNLVRAHVENLVPAAGCTPLVVADHAGDVVGDVAAEFPPVWPPVDPAGAAAKLRAWARHLDERSRRSVAPRRRGPTAPEPGDLGYAVLRCYDAVDRTPARLVVHVVSDVPPSACPSAAGWVGGLPLDARRDGVVVTVLDLPRHSDEAHSDEAVCSMVRAHGREPLVLDLGTTESPHMEITAALERVLAQTSALRDGSATASPSPGRATPEVRWPVILLRTPAGWGSPHVPRDRDDRCDLTGPPTLDPVDLPRLEAWSRSYRPRSSFPHEDVPVEPAR